MPEDAAHYHQAFLRPALQPGTPRLSWQRVAVASFWAVVSGPYAHVTLGAKEKPRSVASVRPASALKRRPFQDMGPKAANEIWNTCALLPPKGGGASALTCGTTGQMAESARGSGRRHGILGAAIPSSTPAPHDWPTARSARKETTSMGLVCDPVCKFGSHGSRFIVSVLSSATSCCPQGHKGLDLPAIATQARRAKGLDPELMLVLQTGALHLRNPV